jgi:hypothetical protein
MKRPNQPRRAGARQEQAFRCLHCHNLVITDSAICGVQNRNHCPYCLRSRHLDLYQAGDRLSACKQAMAPVGLTLKRTRKKYRQANGGELMLIHRCDDCGKLSINRIAADDDPQAIFAVFRGSFEPGGALQSHLTDSLAQQQIQALDQDDLEIVGLRLFGAGAVGRCL